jgi:AAA+ superfamily predicted ATPase
MGTLVTDDLTSYTFDSLLGQEKARELVGPIIDQIKNPEGYHADQATNLFFIGHSGVGATSSVITCNHL